MMAAAIAVASWAVRLVVGFGLSAIFAYVAVLAAGHWLRHRRAASGGARAFRAFWVALISGGLAIGLTGATLRGVWEWWNRRYSGLTRRGRHPTRMGRTTLLALMRR
jgi:hypothetical protein